MSNYLPRSLMFVLIASTIFLGGCYVSEFVLAPVANANLDKALVGEWDFASKDKDDAKRVVATVRNFDGKQYFIEWREIGKDKPDRYAAYLVEFKGAKFLHVRPMNDDGDLEKTWLLARIELTEDTVKIRNLKEEFLKEQKIDSNERLQEVIAANLDKPELYDTEGDLTGTRIKR